MVGRSRGCRREVYFGYDFAKLILSQTYYSINFKKLYIYLKNRFLLQEMLNKGLNFMKSRVKADSSASVHHHNHVYAFTFIKSSIHLISSYLFHF